MHRLIPFFLAVLLLLSLSMHCALSDTVPSLSETSKISRALGTDVSGGTVAASFDSHGGFHGDGLTFVELTFSDDSFGSRVQNRWRPLPLSGNLQAFVYGVSGVGPYITQDGVPCFPFVENGYYYFEDRQAEDTDPHSDLQLFQRYSYNVTIAIYDADAQILYYCKFDT